MSPSRARSPPASAAYICALQDLTRALECNPESQMPQQFDSASQYIERSCLRHDHFRLGSGAVRPSGAAPRPRPPVQSRHEVALPADSTSATTCARTQMTKPLYIALSLVTLLCLPCLAFSESDMTIVDESDIGQSQSYSTARLQCHGDQRPGECSG